LSYLVRAERYAAASGVIVRRAQTPGGEWGVYEHRRRLITLHPDLRGPQLDWTFWHELGHAEYGHVGGDCRRKSKQERQADRWAALHMFDPFAFIQHVQPGMTDQEVACELGALPVAVTRLREALATLQVPLHEVA
jgi:hypothetical protein